ncbi:hypothetical protein ACIBH1_41865 [Nonomuraea sp. NPDC050663]|nr:hypothetical protein [Thermoactinospora sp.]
MSDHLAPEPENQVDELIDDLEVHAVNQGGSFWSVEICNPTASCPC